MRNDEIAQFFDDIRAFIQGNSDLRKVFYMKYKIKE